MSAAPRRIVTGHDSSGSGAVPELGASAGPLEFFDQVLE
jgi:hypothetical protein